MILHVICSFCVRKDVVKSLAVDLNFLVSSDTTNEGVPLLEEKRLSALRNVVALRSVTSSR